MQHDRAPLLVEHGRSAAELAAAMDRRFASLDLAPVGTDPLRDALTRVAARYGEILVERLNAAPDLLRLDLLSRVVGTDAPALPAHAVLTFTPVVSTRAIEPPAVVPAHTPVVAAPAGDDTNPVGFETLEDLTVLQAQAVRAVAVDPARGRWSDAAAVLAPGGAGPQDGPADDLFGQASRIEQAFHLSAPGAFDVPALASIGIDCEVEAGDAQDADASVEWGATSAQGFVPFTVESDASLGLRRSGRVVLVPPADWPVGRIAGATARWLTGRRRAGGPGREPAAAALAPASGEAPAPRPRRPLKVADLRITGAAQGATRALVVLGRGLAPIDASKDFFPFGERPGFGETVTFGSDALERPGTRVTLVIVLTNPARAVLLTGADEPDDAPLPPVDPTGKPVVRWEAHAARGWVALEVEDGTQALTRSGDVRFTLPADVVPAALPGRVKVGVRARLVSGHYGKPVVVDDLPRFVAPSIASLDLHWQLALGPLAPDRIVCDGVFERIDVDPRATPSFVPFVEPDVASTALCVALAAPPGALAGRTLCLQWEPGEPAGRRVAQDPAVPRPRPAARWQWRTEAGWVDAPAEDPTAGLTLPGIVKMRVPAAVAAWRHSTLDARGAWLWMRVVWPGSAAPAGLRRLVLNAVAARQTQRIEDEVLGSGNGRPGQALTALRTPIHGAVELRVREDPDGPAAWIRWNEVRDFSGSGPGSRDFTLDRRRGRIAFGNGRQGRLPPAGANNIRLREYHAGGGARGNRGPGAVAQLRTTVPYVESVVNREASAGGRDEATPQERLRGASAWLRHRDRAVCADDYADLAKQASPCVATAFCRPCADLAAPAGTLPDDGLRRLGAVSVVIVPRDAAARPQPSHALLDSVKAFLDARRPLTASLAVVGPDYAAASVRARIVALADRSAQETADRCHARLADFLHPVGGGLHRHGWSPGEPVQRQDLMAVLRAVDGVVRVDALEFYLEPPAAAAPGTALVCAGTLEVAATSLARPSDEAHSRPARPAEGRGVRQ